MLTNHDGAVLQAQLETPGGGVDVVMAIESNEDSLLVVNASKAERKGSPRCSSNSAALAPMRSRKSHKSPRAQLRRASLTSLQPDRLAQVAQSRHVAHQRLLHRSGQRCNNKMNSSAICQ